MEYGSVRNNIYRLLVSDIYGLGDEVPFAPEEPTDEPNEPDDDEEDDNPPTPPEPGDDDDDEPDYPPTPPGPDDDDDNEDDEPENVNINVKVTVEEWTQLKDVDVYL